MVPNKPLRNPRIPTHLPFVKLILKIYYQMSPSDLPLNNIIRIWQIIILSEGCLNSLRYVKGPYMAVMYMAVTICGYGADP